MCGIAGLVLQPDAAPADLKPDRLLRRMIERLRHRGPEAVSVQRQGNSHCWLAHARLRVSDARDVADQPMASCSGRWGLVFNGEIYNWPQLDGYLKPSGWQPRTAGDTERLVEMIDQVGVECLHSLDGMFAFGAYDQRSRCLFLARDRFGQKPLYLVQGPGMFAFASELSALLELSPWIPMQVSATALAQYMTLRYVPAPGSAVDPIRKLEPGQYAILDARGRLHLDRFFTLSAEGTLCSNDQDHRAVDMLRQQPAAVVNKLLKQSIRNTVPQQAAVIVSGGVDSTLMAAYTRDLDEEMGWPASDRVGYTVQLEHQPPQETQWAARLCQRWYWRHELLTLSDRQLINAYLHLSQRLDEPLGDRSLLPSWILAQAISPHQRVAIGGDGGDELFLGYGRYGAMAALFQKAGMTHNWAELYWQRGLAVGHHGALTAANQATGLKPLQTLIGQLRVLQEQWQEQPLIFLQWLDLLSYLPGAVLAKADRSSMDWGLEVRSPLLNTHLALAGMALQPKHQLQGGQPKAILKQLLQHKVGEPLPAGEKLGFGAAVRPGSELERFLQERIQAQLSSMGQRRGTALANWLAAYSAVQHRWGQNELFAMAIYLDWLERVLATHPCIQVN